MRQAARTDENQKEIVKELRQLGYSVLDLSGVGGGCPDICVGASARNFLFEIKNPAKPQKDRKLTPDQVKFHRSWQGQIRIIETTEDAIKVITKAYARSSPTG